MGFVMNRGVGIGELAWCPEKFPTRGFMTTPRWSAMAESENTRRDGVTDWAAMGTKTFGLIMGDDAVTRDDGE